MEPGLLRIGELSKRTGVSPELLRAWERRYGLLQPDRSAGGLRLYKAEDLERVARMQRHLSAGVAAAEAAALATAGDGETEGVAFDPVAARRDLGSALEAFDEPYAQAVLDSLLTVERKRRPGWVSRTFGCTAGLAVTPKGSGIGASCGVKIF